jgi:hypothetical protein
MGSRKIILVVVGVSIVLTLLFSFLFHAPIELQAELIGVILHLGAAILFISSLSNFKTLLRVAYVCISVASVLASLGALQLPLVTALGGLNSAWVTSGLVGVPFMLAMLLNYSGTHIAANLFKIKSLVNKPWFVALVAAVAGISAVALPRMLGAMDGKLDPSPGIFAFLGTIYLCIAILVFRIKGEASKRYSTSLGWLAITFLFASLSLTQNLVVKLLLPVDHWYAHSVFISLGNVLPAIAVIIAAYSFARLGQHADETFMQHEESATCVSVVAYLAALPSSARDVDSILDGMRTVTAHLAPDSKVIPEQDQQQLAKVCLALMDYLVNKEPLQKFTRPELEQALVRKFPNVNKVNPIFWQQSIGKSV